MGSKTSSGVVFQWTNFFSHKGQCYKYYHTIDFETSNSLIKSILFAIIPLYATSMYLLNLCSV